MFGSRAVRGGNCGCPCFGISTVLVVNNLTLCNYLNRIRGAGIQRRIKGHARRTVHFTSYANAVFFVLAKRAVDRCRITAAVSVPSFTREAFVDTSALDEFFPRKASSFFNARAGFCVLVKARKTVIDTFSGDLVSSVRAICNASSG